MILWMKYAFPRALLLWICHIHTCQVEHKVLDGEQTTRETEIGKFITHRSWRKYLVHF